MESYNMGPIGNSDEFNSALPPLNYLDPELYASQGGGTTSAGIELEGEFICVVCTGVVLNPTECKTCSSLYCKACLSKEDLPCPKRCGGQEYGKVNRMIMNAMNKLPFRCQFSPKCDRIVNYDQYEIHYKECPHGKPIPCENSHC